jgi:hypothetical protein
MEQTSTFYVYYRESIVVLERGVLDSITLSLVSVYISRTRSVPFNKTRTSVYLSVLIIDN